MRDLAAKTWVNVPSPNDTSCRDTCFMRTFTWLASEIVDRVEQLVRGTVASVRPQPVTEEDKEVAWALKPHLSVHLNYIFVFNGRFEERSVHATTTESYICPWITYRF